VARIVAMITHELSIPEWAAFQHERLDAEIVAVLKNAI